MSNCHMPDWSNCHMSGQEYEECACLPCNSRSLSVHPWVPSCCTAPYLNQHSSCYIHQPKSNICNCCLIPNCRKDKPRPCLISSSLSYFSSPRLELENLLPALLIQSLTTSSCIHLNQNQRHVRYVAISWNMASMCQVLFWFGLSPGCWWSWPPCCMPEWPPRATSCFFQEQRPKSLAKSRRLKPSSYHGPELDGNCHLKGFFMSLIFSSKAHTNPESVPYRLVMYETKSAGRGSNRQASSPLSTVSIKH